MCQSAKRVLQLHQRQGRQQVSIQAVRKPHTEKTQPDKWMTFGLSLFTCHISHTHFVFLVRVLLSPRHRVSPRLSQPLSKALSTPTFTLDPRHLPFALPPVRHFHGHKCVKQDISVWTSTPIKMDSIKPARSMNHEEHKVLRATEITKTLGADKVFFTITARHRTADLCLSHSG